MDRPPELPITEEDWSHTPRAVQAVVITLWQQVQALQAEVEALKGEVAQQRKQLGQDSRNSSRPPSSDPPNAPPRPKRTPLGASEEGRTGTAGMGVGSNRRSKSTGSWRSNQSAVLSVGRCGWTKTRSQRAIRMAPSEE